MVINLREEALRYHEFPSPGKLTIELTTSAETAHDLALAYSPGVAEPVREIAKDELDAYKYTCKGNLVAVISNGTAILGLGALGALASKPVMEGKSLLFKKFGGVNSVDVEVDERDPKQLIKIVKAISCTYGGINLEDIKAPECFEVEQTLIEECDIPIFHDDQHGTAIVTVAGLLNALEVQGKRVQEVKVVCLGAGAAAYACCKLIITAGGTPANILMLDSKGVIYKGREFQNIYKEEFAVETTARTLDDAIVNSDVFLGLSGPDLFTPDMLRKMAPNPIVFACSNPDPEIKPEVALQTRSDLLIATGRSDYPNQVNNVLCFPFLFRGALDVRARQINTEMKMAAVHAIKDIAKMPVLDEVKAAYEGADIVFGKEYIIPKPMDPRLIGAVAAAVARAAVDTGSARSSYPAHYPLKTVGDCEKGLKKR